MAADDSGAPHAAPAAGFAASPASHRPPRPDDASSDVVRAVVGARAERQALLVRGGLLPRVRRRLTTKMRHLFCVPRTRLMRSARSVLRRSASATMRCSA